MCLTSLLSCCFHHNKSMRASVFLSEQPHREEAQHYFCLTGLMLEKIPHKILKPKHTEMLKPHSLNGLPSSGSGYQSVGMFLIIYYYTGDKLEKHILHTSLLDSKGPRNAHSSTMSSHLTKEKYNMSFLKLFNCVISPKEPQLLTLPLLLHLVFCF